MGSTTEMSEWVRRGWLKPSTVRGMDRGIPARGIECSAVASVCHHAPEVGLLAPEEDILLIERAAQGDHTAFRRLVEKHQRRTYSIAFGIMRNHEQAMDVAQDAFIKVYGRLSGFEGKARFTTWLYRIVTNLCIDRKRSQKRKAEVDYDDTRAHDPDAAVRGPTLATVYLDDPARAYDRRELREHMGRALDTLSEDHREILLMREVEGLSYEEIAQTLDIAKGTVMSRLFHARKKFQTAILPYLTAP